MLLVKNLVDTVLSADLKELVNDGNSENLTTVVSNLQITLNQYREEINRLAKTNLKILQPELENSENLVSQINSLHEEISHLKVDLEENEKLLKNVSEIEEYKKLIDRIELINKIVLTVDTLQKYDECLEEFTTAIEDKNYLKCKDLILELTSMSNGTQLNQQSDQKTKANKKASDSTSSENEIEFLSDIIVFKKLNEDFTVQKERLWFELNIEWDKLIKIELAAKTEDTISTDSITIQTGITQEHLNKLTVLSPMQKTDQFIFIAKLRQFGKKFLQFCEENIISSSQYNIDIVENGQEGTRTLRLLNDQTEKLSPSDMLELKLNQILQILKFLCKNLFGLQVFTANSPQPKAPLISIFSDIILKDFVQLIYEKLIISIIPLTNFDYQLESEIRQKVNSFECSLKEINFLNKKKTLASVFDSFKNNVEELYVRKKCKFIMEQSRELMKQKEKLFQLVQINERVRSNPFEHVESKELGYVLQSLANFEQDLNFSTNKSSLEQLNLLRMQTCSISEIAQKTVESVYATLNEALSISEKAHDIRNVSLLCIVARNLFEIYASVIPTFYRDGLLELPLLSAIAYNDFIYLGFHCLTISHQYKSMFLGLKESKKLKSLTSSDVNEIIGNFSCLDLVPKLYGIAVDILNRQVEKQRELFMQFLHEDCNGIMDLAEGNNYDLFKRALQKCIFQMNKLSSMWSSILPSQMYYRVFGDFFNLIFSDLVKSCLRLEDISSDDASYLEAAFTLLNKCVYDIFSHKHSENKENETRVESAGDDSLISNKMADLTASKYIKTWQRFNYLVKVLKANLQEIVDMWSESMGPLALFYDSEEIRHLIRALFMITDKRSAALAKIK